MNIVNKHKLTTHNSPLEGESARQGQSPKSSRWGEIKHQYTQNAQQHAKALRQHATDAENLLWYYLRNKQLGGFKFRRQQPIDKYIVDFACMQTKLVIELDGGQHAEQQDYDQQRDNFIKNAGYQILRFWNHEVITDCFTILEKIYLELIALIKVYPPTGSSASYALDSPTPPQGWS